MTKERDDAVGPAGQFHHDATSIVWISASPDIASRLESIDGDGQGAAGQADCFPELAGWHGSEAREVIEAAQVGTVHVKVLGDGCIEEVTGGRERAQAIEDRLTMGRRARA
jgi:hypothetical protein